MFYSYLESPIGRLLLAGPGGRLGVIGFSTGRRTQAAGCDWERHDAYFDEAKRQLTDFFEGRRRTFELSLAPLGTSFQHRVWNALGNIPYGETRTYKDIAVAIGNPNAALAVGGANAGNPLPIVVPCHRVIGSDGKLTGYAGGLPAKRYLLDLETENAG